MTRVLLSTYIRKGELILMEVVDGVLTFRREVYDNTDYAALNTLRSVENTFLSIDPVILQDYIVETDGYGQVSFEHVAGSKGGYIDHHRVGDIQLDIFVLHNKIVHVQNYEQTTVDDKIVDEIIGELKYSDYTPETFIEMVDKKFEEAGVELEKEMDKLVFNEPQTE
jgi:hypothetical protein